MKYWDSSALVPLLTKEKGTDIRRSLLRQDPGVVTWWGSSVECVSALRRLEREQKLDAPGVAAASEVLIHLESAWIEVEPSARLRLRARRLLGVHPLRAADALQLAAALVAAGEDPGILHFVSGDIRLSEAAAREGFTVL